MSKGQKIVNILNLDDFATKGKHVNDISKLNTIAIIPIRGKSLKVNGKNLIEYTIDTLRKSNSCGKYFMLSQIVKKLLICLYSGSKSPMLETFKIIEDYVDVLEVINLCQEN